MSTCTIIDPHSISKLLSNKTPGDSQLLSPGSSSSSRASYINFVPLVPNFRISALVAFVTSLLLAGSSYKDSSTQLDLWATFLGVTSTFLAAFQYLPQIVHTYHHKLVGALSIGMMLIQTPGAILMVTSIALRPGTNWTSKCIPIISSSLKAISTTIFCYEEGYFA